MASGVCIARPDVCASRWRTVDPGGPAGVSSSTTPSSIAICAARATRGLVTDASRNARSTGPRVASTPAGDTTAAAAFVALREALRALDGAPSPLEVLQAFHAGRVIRQHNLFSTATEEEQRATLHRVFDWWNYGAVPLLTRLEG